MRTLICIFCALSCAMAGGQSRLASLQATSDPNLLDAAEQALLEFALSVQSRPKSISAYARGESSGTTGEALRFTDLTILFAEDFQSSSRTKATPFRYVAFCVTQVGGNGPLWDQHLFCGENRLRRYGRGDSYDGHYEVDKFGTIVGTKEKGGRLLMDIDFYILPLCNYGTFIDSGANEKYLAKFIRESKVKRAAHLQNGDVVGIWQWGEVLASITFDKSSGMPVRTQWRLMKDGDLDESLRSGRIFSLTTTKWRGQEFAEEKLMVPWCIEINDFGNSEKSSQSETKFIVKYLYGDKVLGLLPKYETDMKKMSDWRVPITSEFDENDKISFAEFEIKVSKAK